MKILQITPGTGTFYCGQCLRDVALVRELRRQGHDAACVPLYLPIVAEGDDMTDGRMFFGGINVYLQQKSGFFQKTPRWLDKLWDSKGLLYQAARAGHMTSAHELGEMTISMLRGEEGRQGKELDRLVKWIESQPKPDLICLANGLLTGMAGPLKRRLGVPVVCTLQGEASFLDDLVDPFRDQAWDLMRQGASDVLAFLAVSDYYANTMRDRMQMGPENIVAVHNGIDFTGYEQRPAWPDPPVIGFLARMNELKGLGTLVDAFIQYRKQDTGLAAQLRVAGAMTPPDKEYVAGLKLKLEEAGLLGDVSFHPNISRGEKIEFLKGLTVVSVPAMYGEAFGLYVIEALGCGVPFVQPNHASFPEIHEATGGGLLYSPEREDDLVTALSGLLSDREKNERLGSAGREKAMEVFSVQQMAGRVLDVYNRVTGN